jgi:hypothetical protein
MAPQYPPWVSILDIEARGVERTESSFILMLFSAVLMLWHRRRPGRRG